MEHPTTLPDADLMSALLDALLAGDVTIGQRSLGDRVSTSDPDAGRIELNAYASPREQREALYRELRATTAFFETPRPALQLIPGGAQ